MTLSLPRNVRFAAVLALGFGLLAGAVPAATAADEPEAWRPLAELLDSGALRDAANPVVLDFLLGEAGAAVPAEVRGRAVEDLTAALREDALVSPFEGIGKMPGAALGSVGEGLRDSVKPGNLLRSALGVGRRPDPERGRRAQERMEATLTDHWVRGVDAAGALGRAGEEEAAHDFYRSCLQWAMVDWVVARCIDGTIDLGPDLALGTFSELIARPYHDLGIDFRALGAEPPEQEPVPLLRAAGLRGVGRLLEREALDSGTADGAVAALVELIRGEGGVEEPLSLAAAVEALARSGHPEAERMLRRIVDGEVRRKLRKALRESAESGGGALSVGRVDPLAAAREALAVEFRDPKAIEGFRRDLRKKEGWERYRAARVLIEAGEEEGFAWAGRWLARERLPRGEPDVRSALVLDLAGAGGPRARRVLESALEVQGETWLGAWTAAALVELGDPGHLERLARDVRREEWELGRRTAGRWLGAAATTVRAAFHYALGDQERAARIVLDLAFAERDRYAARERRRRERAVRLRWRTADALAAVDHPEAVPILADLLENPETSVRLSAAWALSAQSAPAAAEPLARAVRLEYGEEAGRSRSPEVRAALLASLVRRFPHEPATEELLDRAPSLPDPSVRFLALAARPAPAP